jgi:hypothetical protein
VLRVTSLLLLVGCGAPALSLDAGVDAGAEPDAGAVDAGAPGPCTTDTWATYGATFFTSTCGGCHFNLSSQSGVESKLSTIAGLIEAGDMPRGGVLSEADRVRAVRYLTCGAP